MDMGLQETWPLFLSFHDGGSIDNYFYFLNVHFCETFIFSFNNHKVLKEINCISGYPEDSGKNSKTTKSVGAASSNTAAFTESQKKIWKQELQPAECVWWSEKRTSAQILQGQRSDGKLILWVPVIVMLCCLKIASNCHERQFRPDQSSAPIDTCCRVSPSDFEI